MHAKSAWSGCTTLSICYVGKWEFLFSFSLMLSNIGIRAFSPIFSVSNSVMAWGGGAGATHRGVGGSAVDRFGVLDFGTGRSKCEDVNSSFYLSNGHSLGFKLVSHHLTENKQFVL